MFNGQLLDDVVAASIPNCEDQWKENRLDCVFDP
jgi:hypothetical protein